MPKLEMTISGKTFECRDGDVVGQRGTIANDLVADRPEIAERHLLVGKQDGRWFMLVPLNVATPTIIHGEAVPHGVRIPIAGVLQIKLGELPIRLSSLDEDAPAAPPTALVSPESSDPEGHMPLPFQLSILPKVVNSVGDLIAVVDAQGRRIWNNAAYARVLGYSPEELRGTYALAEVHPDDRPLLKEVAAESMRTGVGRRIEYQMRHRNGSWVALESEGAIIPESKDQEKLLVIIARDITARRKVEQENRERSRRQIEQLASLSSFASSPEFHAGDLERCFSSATEELIKVTDSDRAAIWLFDAAAGVLKCADLYTRSLAKHSAGDRLAATECPEYFAALRRDRVIVADAAFEAPHLRELRSSYLVGHQIVSKLDAPILRSGELVGVLTCESATARQWAIDEQGFLTSLADLILLASTTRDRLRAFQALKESQEKLAGELAEAASYVRSQLPPPLTGPIETDWRFIPSAQLGGDAFGYRWLDENHFAFYVLDTVGHGVRAAMLSVMAINFLRGDTAPGVAWEDPSSVLAALNQSFQMREADEMYFTIWYGVLDRRTSSIRYSAAGHPPAILFTGPTGESAAPVELRAHALMIGAASDTVFESHTQVLEAFNKLFVFSDGVYEIPRSDGTLWTLDEFKQTLQTPPPAGVAELDGVVQRVREIHQSPDLPDDVSIVRLSFQLS